MTCRTVALDPKRQSLVIPEVLPLIPGKFLEDRANATLGLREAELKRRRIGHAVIGDRHIDGVRGPLTIVEEESRVTVPRKEQF